MHVPLKPTTNQPLEVQLDPRTIRSQVRIMAEPAIDSAGNVWVTYARGEELLYVAGTPDEGQTWPWVYNLTPHVRLAFQEGRLGDFFETTVGPDGYLYGAWSNTYRQPNDVISHPEFAKQVGGIRLIADDELGLFFPTQG
ncbi:MAG: hypothetical protein AABY18_03450 [Candidatus Thermoplasmatota archaeon]